MTNASFFRTDTFTGSRYESALVSNQIDVFHVEVPMVAVAFNLPHPSSADWLIDRIFFEVDFGMVTKHHPAGPSYFQSFALNENLMSTLFFNTAHLLIV